MRQAYSPNLAMKNAPVSPELHNAGMCQRDGASRRTDILCARNKRQICQLLPLPPTRISYKSTAILHARVFIMSSSIYVNMIFIVCNEVIIKGGTEGTSTFPVGADGKTRREYGNPTYLLPTQRKVR